MKKDRIIALVILMAGLGVLSGSFNARAEEEKPTASADVGIFSKYVWRGYELSDDSIVIQPSATVGYRGFSMNLWGNLDLDFDDMDPTINDKTEWTETDLTLSYDTSFGPVGIGGGYIYYGLVGVGDDGREINDSQEFYFSISYDILLAPTLTIYREIAHLPGWYLNFGISHSFELPEGITLDLSGSLGYYSSDDDDFVEVDDNLNATTNKYSNFHDGVLSAGLTIPFAQYFSVAPMIAYSFALTDNAENLLRSASFSDDSDFFYGGLTVAISF